MISPSLPMWVLYVLNACTSHWTIPLGTWWDSWTPGRLRYHLPTGGVQTGWRFLHQLQIQQGILPLRPTRTGTCQPGGLKMKQAWHCTDMQKPSYVNRRRICACIFHRIHPKNYFEDNVWYKNKCAKCVDKFAQKNVQTTQ